MTLTPEQAIAALRRAAAQLRIDSASFESKRLAQGTINDSFTLDELADVLQEGRLMWQGPDYADQISSDPVIGWREIWIVPAPRIEP